MTADTAAAALASRCQRVSTAARAGTASGSAIAARVASTNETAKLAGSRARPVPAAFRYASFSDRSGRRRLPFRREKGPGAARFRPRGARSTARRPPGLRTPRRSRSETPRRQARRGRRGSPRRGTGRIPAGRATSGGRPAACATTTPSRALPSAAAARSRKSRRRAACEAHAATRTAGSVPSTSAGLPIQAINTVVPSDPEPLRLPPRAGAHPPPRDASRFVACARADSDTVGRGWKVRRWKCRMAPHSRRLPPSRDRFSPRTYRIRHARAARRAGRGRSPDGRALRFLASRNGTSSPSAPLLRPAPSSSPASRAAAFGAVSPQAGAEGPPLRPGRSARRRGSRDVSWRCARGAEGTPRARRRQPCGTAIDRLGAGGQRWAVHGVRPASSVFHPCRLSQGRPGDPAGGAGDSRLRQRLRGGRLAERAKPLRDPRRKRLRLRRRGADGDARDLAAGLVAVDPSRPRHRHCRRQCAHDSDGRCDPALARAGAAGAARPQPVPPHGRGLADRHALSRRGRARRRRPVRLRRRALDGLGRLDPARLSRRIARAGAAARRARPADADLLRRHAGAALARLPSGATLGGRRRAVAVAVHALVPGYAFIVAGALAGAAAGALCDE